jgi:hypothetical protein
MLTLVGPKESFTWRIHLRTFLLHFAMPIEKPMLGDELTVVIVVVVLGIVCGDVTVDRLCLLHLSKHLNVHGG